MGFRFGVYFFTNSWYKGTQPNNNRVDMSFKKVSGIGSTVLTRTLNEGGQNQYSRKFPERVQYDNLVLERGFVVDGSIGSFGGYFLDTHLGLGFAFNYAMTTFSLSPFHVLVTLFSEDNKPLSSWLFVNAYPVKWAISNLDADSNTVVIETMELAYQRMQQFRI